MLKGFYWQHLSATDQTFEGGVTDLVLQLFCQCTSWILGPAFGFASCWRFWLWLWVRLWPHRWCCCLLRLQLQLSCDPDPVKPDDAYSSGRHKIQATVWRMETHGTFKPTITLFTYTEGHLSKWHRVCVNTQYPHAMTWIWQSYKFRRMRQVNQTTAQGRILCACAHLLQEPCRHLLCIHYGGFTQQNSVLKHIPKQSHPAAAEGFRTCGVPWRSSWACLPGPASHESEQRSLLCRRHRETPPHRTHYCKTQTHSLLAAHTHGQHAVVHVSSLTSYCTMSLVGNVDPKRWSVQIQMMTGYFKSKRCISWSCFTIKVPRRF